jgi:hypothetical protein
MKYLLLLLLLMPCVLAQNPFLPEEVVNLFYQNNTELLLTKTEILLFETDNTNIYYSMPNYVERPLNLSFSAQCMSEQCPLTFDSFWNDTINPNQKKVTALFIYSNHTAPGIYVYNLTAIDVETNQYYASQTFSVEVISRSLWKQFWYNFFDTIIFWR